MTVEGREEAALCCCSRSREVKLLLLDGQVLAVRELVDGAAVARDLERGQHLVRDAAAEAGLAHEARDGLEVVPALLARHLRQVRRAVQAAAGVAELDDDAVDADLDHAQGVSGRAGRLPDSEIWRARTSQSSKRSASS